jgi:magnesium transporter
MKNQQLFELIRADFDRVIDKSSHQGMRLRKEFDALHPADKAYFFSTLDFDESKQLFLAVTPLDRLDIFSEFSDARKVVFCSFLDDSSLRELLTQLPVDELTEFFDELSDEDLKHYLKLLQASEREQVLSLLKLQEDSAGRNMEMNVVTLLHDFTVARSIQLLQRLQPDQELSRRIYVTKPDNTLVGYILLEDLVVKKPETKLASIVRVSDFIAKVDEDQEAVAHKMIHYGVTNAPVVDHKKRFLGVITSDALVDIMEEESSEDIFRMATMRPIRASYFEISFFRLLFQRSSILIVLLFAQIFSTMLMEHYEALLAGFLTYFITMLASTGGNASSQTSALVIQGLATGDINNDNIYRFVGRELRMAVMMGFVLSIISFIRTYWWYHELLGSIAVSISLGVIVVISVTLGSCIPLVLRRLNVDPAHSAGPLLATLMDVIGLLIYCTICTIILT